MKAIYSPIDKENIFNYLRDSIGKEFNFKHARSVCGVKKFWPDDINFPSSNPVPEYDLEFSEATKEEEKTK